MEKTKKNIQVDLVGSAHLTRIWSRPQPMILSGWRRPEEGRASACVNKLLHIPMQTGE